MKKLILVSGKANSGKNTTIDYMRAYLEIRGYKTCEMAFASYLKQLCKTHYDWNGDKDQEGRTLLQYLGTDVIRDKLKWNDFHCKRVCEDIQIVGDEYDFIFVSDLRFSNEGYYTKSIFLDKCTTVLVNRPNMQSKLSEEQKSHKSENAMGGYKFDWTIYNDTTLEMLNWRAINYCKVILGVK